MGRKDEVSLREFAGQVRAAVLAELERSFVKGLESRHDLLSYEIEKSVRAGLKAFLASARAAPAKNEWVGVESLSRLRNLVGGRFQNVKRKWMKAGLPLRAHRGDRLRDFELDEKAWIDLTSWILKQGFEVRQTDNSDFLFEIKPLPGHKRANVSED